MLKVQHVASSTCIPRTCHVNSIRPTTKSYPTFFARHIAAVVRGCGALQRDAAARPLNRTIDLKSSNRVVSCFQSFSIQVATTRTCTISKSINHTDNLVCKTGH